MVDEFVYQYQETQRWKAQYAKDIVANPAALEALRSGSNAWRCSDVLSLLTRLIQTSGIKQYLTNEQRQRQHPAASVNPRLVEEPDLPVTLGYFGIISLMRLHVAMGDYRAALTVGSLIELSPTGLYWKVPAAHITLFYNLGFAYMMMRRYQDAIRVLSQILTFLGRSRSYLSTQSYQQDAMLRMTERMYHLVLLCNALSPTRLDETIQVHIQDHLADKHFKLQSDEEDAYREVFLKAAPKFFNPFVSDYSNPQETIGIDKDEPTNRQVNMFLKDASYQNKVFNVRSIAKLYNNLTLTKLSNLMGLKQENAVEIVRSEMLCVKNRAEQLIWRSGPLLSGERVQMLADLDIYLETDTIHVKNLTTQRSYIDYFIKQIHRTQDLLNNANAPTRPEVKKQPTAVAD
ncbi:eukaryotic translation initiation factor 3 subunit L-like [Condylostylus longicornis]|uniref:eukaryotic translation initiation factor 3 subunit L-like n=1 Tax=Condylostylus longicornis TaxID=2530218 RepID=UPI00244E547E|nr:eukaryotic translation initiation factor 3 subunit L-like [Condylostylus longicornis]